MTYHSTEIIHVFPARKAVFSDFYVHYKLNLPVEIIWVYGEYILMTNLKHHLVIKSKDNLLWQNQMHICKQT